MTDLLLPRTDAGVAAQTIVAAAVFTVVLVAVRRHAEARIFVAGLAVMTSAWFALRTVH
jgi:hypothetical protein